MINVLITTAGSVSGMNCIKALQSQDELQIRIIACDVNQYAAGLYISDNCYLVPPFENEIEYVNSLLKICKEESIDVLLPTFSKDLPIIAKYIEEFKSLKVNTCISSLASIEIFSNKWKSYQFLKNNNIKTPETWLLNNLNEIATPIYVKPIIGSGSRKNYVAQNDIELSALKAIIKQDEYIAQPVIEGPEFTIDVMADFESNVLSMVPRERLLTKNGLAVVSRTVEDSGIGTIIEEIISKGRIIGPCNLQYFKLKENRLLVFDVNTRFAAGGLPLSIKSGINSPLNTVKLALGQRVQKNKSYKKNLIMIRYYTELFLEI